MAGKILRCAQNDRSIIDNEQRTTDNGRSMPSPLTTHVLDIRLGKPAVGVSVQLSRMDASGGWHKLASGKTNDDGRAEDLLPEGALELGVHRLTFDVGPYFSAQQVEYFYPQVTVEFVVTDLARHHHVPLLLSPFGYSTYRGS
jgi:5-hydroxyisourate hydrolase